MNGYFDRVGEELRLATERRYGAGDTRSHQRRRSRRLRGHGYGRMGGGSGANRRRWWHRPSRPLVIFIATCLVGGTAAAAALLSGQRSAPLSGATPALGSATGSLRSLAGTRYDIELYPQIQGGLAGWADLITFSAAGRLRYGQGGGGLPVVGSPLFAGEHVESGKFSYVLTAPQVAAVRLSNQRTILTRGDSRLPVGIRAAVFQSPAHGPNTVTALDAAGRVIRYVHTFEPPEPTTFWRRPQRVARGSCSITAAKNSGLQADWGRVVTTILADPQILGRAFLSCIDTWYYLHGSAHDAMDAAVLLDATHPGAPPAPLPDMTAVPGHPGIFDREGTLFGRLTARRVGNAWLVVRGATNLQQRISAINALTVGPINLTTRPPADARCSISNRRVPGLQAVGEYTPPPSAPTRGADTASRTCITAVYYLDRFPLQATIASATTRLTALIEAHFNTLPGYPRTYTLSQGRLGTLTAQRDSDLWLLIQGGTGLRQQLALLSDLTIHHAATTGQARKR